jgi:hypothetical protein
MVKQTVRTSSASAALVLSPSFLDITLIPARKAILLQNQALELGALHPWFGHLTVRF